MDLPGPVRKLGLNILDYEIARAIDPWCVLMDWHASDNHAAGNSVVTQAESKAASARDRWIKLTHLFQSAFK